MTTCWDLVKHYLTPVAHYFDMPGVTDILIDRFDRIYIDRYGKLEGVTERFQDNHEVETLIRQIANSLEQPISNDHYPILDARLPAQNGRPGARINAVLTPVATQGACLSIRVFPATLFTAEDLLEKNVFTQEMLDFLKLAVATHCNLIISGGTGSGKTTLMNILANVISNDERIITIEDTAELNLNAPFLTNLEAPRRRVDASKNSHVITMAGLLQNVLRQRPDRIIVGELRSADAASSFLQAINTGHQGCMTTLHANSTIDAVTRLEGLFAAGTMGLPYEAIQAQVRANIQLIVQVQRLPNVGRRIVEITELNSGKAQHVWSWNYVTNQHQRICEVKSSAIEMRASQFSMT